MTKSAKRILSLAISGVTAMAAGGALLAPARMSVYAEEAQQAEVPISAHSDEGIMPLACTYVEMPTIKTGSMNAHNCVVTYSIKQADTHATTIEGKKNTSDRDTVFKWTVYPGYTRNIAVTSLSNTLECYPTSVLYIRSKCEADNIYSPYNDYLITSSKTTSRYTTDGGVNFVTYIPTSYDKASFVWKHNLKTDDYIHFSFVYKGNVWDGAIQVPWIGYKTTEYTLDGVKFYVRTGPNKFSIKTDAEGLGFNSYDTMFAYHLG